MHTRPIFALWWGILLMLISGCNLSQSAPPPTPDLPTVYFVAPANNARVLENADLTVDIYAEDSTVGIARVEFRVNGVMVKDAGPANFGVSNQFRVQMNWLAQGIGLHIFSVVAFRPDGTPSDETFITIEVVSE
jgi:hypothetical protein